MLNERLREARKAAKMTQKEVASAINVTESTYCGYETGKRRPDAVTITALARVLNVSGDFLLETGFDDKKEKPTIVTDDGLDSLDVQLIEILKTLSQAEKRMILAQLQVLTANREGQQ